MPSSARPTSARRRQAALLIALIVRLWSADLYRIYPTSSATSGGVASNTNCVRDPLTGHAYRYFWMASEGVIAFTTP